MIADAAHFQTAFTRSKPQKPSPRLYICNVCLRRFLSEESLKTHFDREKNHGYKSSCTKCGKVFKSLSGYDYHAKMQHGKREGSVICNVCGISVYNKSTLEKHMVKHSNIRGFKCGNCGKEFKHKTTLSMHLRNCRKCD